MRYAALFWSACALAQTPVSFNRDLKPILTRQCIGCHQPQSQQSGLLLTTYDGFAKGGTKGPSFIAGKPAESNVIRYLTGEIKPSMPFGGKQLPAEQIDLFRRWVAEGAKNDAEIAPSTTTPYKVPVYSHPPLVTAIAYSPDGKILAVSGYREILLHRVEAGKPVELLARLAGHSMRIHGLAFSADGKTLVATGGDPAQSGEIQVWDVATRKQKFAESLATDTFFGVSLSPDSTRAAFGGADKSIRVYDIVEGKQIRKMDHHEDWVFATIFGTDGKRLVSVSRDRAAKLTDANTGQFLENVNLLRDSLTAIARHPKRDWVLVGGQDRTPYLYRMDRPRAMRIADDSTLIRQFPKQDGPILALAFSPDGSKIAVAAEVGDVHIYDTETAALVATCKEHEGGIYALRFSPGGETLAAGGFDGKLRIYDLQGHILTTYIPVPIGAAAVAQR